MENWYGKLWVGLLIAGFGMIAGQLLLGCTTASKVKKIVAQDLTAMVEQQDCQSNCTNACEQMKQAVKAYIASKLGQ